LVKWVKVKLRQWSWRRRVSKKRHHGDEMW
jgi:hypothetical protein